MLRTVAIETFPAMRCVHGARQECLLANSSDVQEGSTPGKAAKIDRQAKLTVFL